MQSLLLALGTGLLAFAGPIWFWQVVPMEQEQEPRLGVVALSAAIIGVGAGLVSGAFT